MQQTVCSAILRGFAPDYATRNRICTVVLQKLRKARSDVSTKKNIANRINHIVVPLSDIKYHTLASAEVVRGGIDTADISSKTMESKLCPGLFFAGEVIDIAGDLGGFNLQWAWASAHAVAKALKAQL